MKTDDGGKSALKVQKGVTQPPCVNPDVLAGDGRKRRKQLSIDEYVEGVLAGNRTVLGRAITLIESSLQCHYDMAQRVIAKCLPYSGKSFRIGITGVPGAGKSTFIETFGLHITEAGNKLAVLAIDPSSGRTGGSILGDKTRMEQLSLHPNAFIRPSPSAGTLGGVAGKTRDSIILCEAAGFDTIIVETVGVGQSETTVHSMVDFFLLLMLSGAGDELQGIKRGILEMADMIAVNKADGSNRLNADATRLQLKNTLNLFPRKPSGWPPEVLTCSALTDNGISEIRNLILSFQTHAKKSGWFDQNRRQQAVFRMHDTIADFLKNSFYTHELIKDLLPDMEKDLMAGKITSDAAAMLLIDKYFKK